jgi:hypothetical protein
MNFRKFIFVIAPFISFPNSSMSSSQAQISSTFLLNLKLNFINFWKLAFLFILIFLVLRLVEIGAVFQIHSLGVFQNPNYPFRMAH